MRRRASATPKRSVARGPLRLAVRLLAIASVLGGLALLGGTAWQTWVRDPAAGAAQTRAADAQSARWAQPHPSTTAAPSATAPPVDARPIAAPPVAVEPGAVGAPVAVLRIPRFGASWSRIVRQGVDEAAVLNSFTAGVGHYTGTAMPGGTGNFAVAGHDTGWGDAFRHVDRLRVGDRIVVQTAAGWYTYRFRNFQWVRPTAVEVIAPVPGTTRAPEARLITLTTCDPPYDAQERLIAYGTFGGFRAAAEGPPVGW